jgi:hypothetical protein
VKQIRKRLTYANVMSSIAVFLVLGGATAFAASKITAKQLQANSVTTAKIKKNAVTASKIKNNAITTGKIANGAVTGAKVNVATLGTVPSATLANSIPPAEATHLVGAPGQPGFENGAVNVGSSGPLRLSSAGFYKDHEGIVHLEGIVKVGSGSSIDPVFTLPPGYRPAAGTVLIFEQISESATIIGGSNTGAEGIDLSGKVVGASGETMSLDGITFRAAS